MNDTCIDGSSGGCWGAIPPNVFAPYGKSAFFSYYSVNFAIFLYHSVTSASVLYQVVAFLGLTFSVGMEKSRLVSLFLLSDFLSEALKLKKSFKVINI